jgi:hypothetical protein
VVTIRSQPARNDLWRRQSLQPPERVQNLPGVGVAQRIGKVGERRRNESLMQARGSGRPVEFITLVSILPNPRIAVRDVAALD